MADDATHASEASQAAAQGTPEPGSTPGAKAAPEVTAKADTKPASETKPASKDTGETSSAKTAPDAAAEPKSEAAPAKAAAASAPPEAKAASLFGVLDADQRIRAATERSERTLWLSAAAVTLLYATVIGSQVLLRVPLAEAERERQRRGQDALPESISVELVPDPDKASKTKKWREGAATQAPTPTEQPPQTAALAQPEVPKVTPSQEADEAKEEPREEGSPLLLDIESLVDAAAADLTRKIDRAYARKPQKKQRQRQAVAPGGGIKVRGTGASGKSDAFFRSVIAALMKTRPGPFALWGSALVSFQVSETGKLLYVRLLDSSGNDALDQAAINAIRKARFKRPPPGLTPEERTYIIEYVFGFG